MDVWQSAGMMTAQFQRNGRLLEMPLAEAYKRAKLSKYLRQQKTYRYYFGELKTTDSQR